MSLNGLFSYNIWERFSATMHLIFPTILLAIFEAKHYETNPMVMLTEYIDWLNFQNFMPMYIRVYMYACYVNVFYCNALNIVIHNLSMHQKI